MENNIKEQVIQNSYNEVYGILMALGNDFISKVPKDVLKNITKKMSYAEKNGQKDYDIPKYDLKISLNIQGVSKEAIAIIYYFYYNYWCVSKKEKMYLENLIKNNRRKCEEAKRKKYGNVDIFKNRDETEENAKNAENTLIDITAEKWYKEIFRKILNIFKRK